MGNYSYDRIVSFWFGVYWEWRKMPLVDLELGRGLAELHQKKTAALEDVLRPEMVEAPYDSPVWKAKMDHLNSIEKSLARLEGRAPVHYGRPGPISIRLRVK